MNLVSVLDPQLMDIPQDPFEDFILQPGREPEYYDQVFEDLCSEEVRSLTPDQIWSLICEKLAINILFTQTMDLNPEGIDVYRVTNFQPPPGETELIEHYSYAPKPGVGRANLAGNGVFYCSPHPNTCFKEMRALMTGDHFISHWKLKFPEEAGQLVLFGFDGTEGGLNERFSEKIRSGLEVLFNRFGSDNKEVALSRLKVFSRIFSEPNERAYHLSSVLAHSLLGQGFKNMIIGCYPSSRDRNSMNFAVPKEFASNSKYLELVSVLKVRVTKHDSNGTVYNFFSKGFNVEGKIKWTSPTRQLKYFSLAKVFLNLHCNEVYREFDPEQVEITNSKQHQNLFSFLKEVVLPKSVTPPVHSPSYTFQQIDFLTNETIYEHGIPWVIPFETKIGVKLDNDEHVLKSIVVTGIYEDRFA